MTARVDGLNAFQVRAVDGAPGRVTSCGDGRCVEIAFRTPVVGDTIAPGAFIVAIGVESSARRTTVAYSTLFADPRVAASDRPEGAPDTITVDGRLVPRVDVAVLPLLSRERVLATIRGALSTLGISIPPDAPEEVVLARRPVIQVSLVGTPFIVGGAQPPGPCVQTQASPCTARAAVPSEDVGTCAGNPNCTYRSSPVESGLATWFTYTVPRGSPPVLIDWSIRPATARAGLLEPGRCADALMPPARACPADGNWFYFPPHGEIAGRFDAVPYQFNLVVETSGRRVLSALRLATGAVPSLGAITWSGSSFTVGRPASLATTGLPFAQIFDRLEVASEQTLIDLGPARFDLPVYTTNDTGESVERGSDHVTAFQVSPVAFEQPTYSFTTDRRAVAVRVDPRVASMVGTLRLRAGPVVAAEISGPIDASRPIAMVVSIFPWPTNNLYRYPLRVELRGAGTAESEFLGYDVVPVDFAGTDPDRDLDGVPDGVDNCPDTPNPLQEDLDGDHRGDACDDDVDGDGVLNVEELTIWHTDPRSADTDGDGVRDGAETHVAAGLGSDPLRADTDGDGINDNDESGDTNCDGIPDRLDGDNATPGQDPGARAFRGDRTLTLSLGTETPPGTTADFVFNATVTIRGQTIWVPRGTPTPEAPESTALSPVTAFSFDSAIRVAPTFDAYIDDTMWGTYGRRISDLTVTPARGSTYCQVAIPGADGGVATMEPCEAAWVVRCRDTGRDEDLNLRTLASQAMQRCVRDGLQAAAGYRVNSLGTQCGVGSGATAMGVLDWATCGCDSEFSGVPRLVFRVRGAPIPATASCRDACRSGVSLPSLVEAYTHANGSAGRADQFPWLTQLAGPGDYDALVATSGNRVVNFVSTSTTAATVRMRDGDALPPRAETTTVLKVRSGNARETWTPMGWTTTFVRPTAEIAGIRGSRATMPHVIWPSEVHAADPTHIAALQIRPRSPAPARSGGVFRVWVRPPTEARAFTDVHGARAVMSVSPQVRTCDPLSPGGRLAGLPPNVETDNFARELARGTMAPGGADVQFNARLGCEGAVRQTVAGDTGSPAQYDTVRGTAAASTPILRSGQYRVVVQRFRPCSATTTGPCGSGTVPADSCFTDARFVDQDDLDISVGLEHVVSVDPTIPDADMRRATHGNWSMSRPTLGVPTSVAVAELPSRAAAAANGILAGDVAMRFVPVAAVESRLVALEPFSTGALAFTTVMSAIPGCGRMRMPAPTGAADEPLIQGSAYPFNWWASIPPLDGGPVFPRQACVYVDTLPAEDWGRALFLVPASPSSFSNSRVVAGGVDWNVARSQTDLLDLFAITLRGLVAHESAHVATLYHSYGQTGPFFPFGWDFDSNPGTRRAEWSSNLRLGRQRGGRLPANLFVQVGLASCDSLPPVTGGARPGVTAPCAVGAVHRVSLMDLVQRLPTGYVMDPYSHLQLARENVPQWDDAVIVAEGLNAVPTGPTQPALSSLDILRRYFPLAGVGTALRRVASPTRLCAVP